MGWWLDQGISRKNARRNIQVYGLIIGNVATKLLEVRNQSSSSGDSLKVENPRNVGLTLPNTVNRMLE